ncbi:MAG: hypothetical protein MUF52_13925 [Syntrophobacteraceae bacterium]|jgi:hypothetical protein|nr:hypothetical protein [Syntrophobacteraceae bacterium]MCU0589236.1 hypothetical protein [Syntrophobacteraceae bacterium]
MNPENRDDMRLWRFVALSEYERPPEPAGEKVRRGVRGFWDRLFGKDGPRGRGESCLESGTGDLPGSAATAPDWREAVPALQDVLKEWCESGEERDPLRVVLNAPHGGTRRVVSLWAGQGNWRVIEPPEARQLLAGGRDRLRELDLRDETPWLIPGLEKWYLRHHDALDPVRELLDILASRRRPTLICCDSWAWAYLCGTVQADLVLPQPLIMAAFDRERLGWWLRSLCGLEGGCSALFRQTNSEKFILPPAELPGEREELEISDFLGRLAAFSRGNPGVAWALWHKSLGGAGAEDHVGAAGTRVRTIWMRPWRDLDMPAVPQRNRSRLAMVLHTLLLHNGVATGILPELLPNLARVVRQDLHDLRAAGLVDREHDLWRVTAIAYPVVRATLEGEDFLVDGL